MVLAAVSNQRKVGFEWVARMSSHDEVADKAESPWIISQDQERMGAAGNERSVDARVEGDKAATVLGSQGEQIMISGVVGGGKRRETACVRQGKTVRPRLAARGAEQAQRNAACLGRRAKVAGVLRMAEDSDEGVLGKGAGRPSSCDSLVLELA